MTTRAPAELDDTAVEVLRRATERGYVLLSELEDLRDPLAPVVVSLEDAALELGIEVIDDLTLAEGETLAETRLALLSDPVRQYMNIAGRHEVLDKEDEADLAKRYQAGLAARVLIETSKLSAKKRGMLRSIIRDGERAKESMIRHNLRLVVAQARKWQGHGLDMIELIQEGNLGLIRAVEKFDHTKGYKFSTYAVWWIRQSLQRGISNQGRTIRLPVHVWEESAKLKRVEAELRQHLGRDPTEVEIATGLGVTMERLRDLREALQGTASLDSPVGEDGEASLGDLIPDANALGPEATAAEADVRERIDRALAGLDSRERIIVELRFGFLDGQPRTLDEIGQQFDLSRERIRQLEHEALAKLRHPATAARLETLLREESAA